MKVTSEDIKKKQVEAALANNIGWLDTAKMDSQGIKANPMKLTGYVKPENPFKECQAKRPDWGF